MQIVIPMSGFGERFRRAGFKVPKPLIEVEGKPIIAHVIGMFPGEKDFIFICNNDHLKNEEYQMEAILRKYCPTGRIVGIPSHKLGPINAVKQIEGMIDLSKPVIVNYCDFSCYWDWENFKSFVTETNCDGAIPAYKGFHPHSLGSTNYAYLLENNGVVLDIQEKQPYTDNRMEEFASSGTYYFSSGLEMLESFNETMSNNVNVGGEYYVSLAYKSILAQNKSVLVYPLQHFMQWGTPEDLAEYNGWSNIFKNLINIKPEKRELPLGTALIPMAGLGKRFSDEGYPLTKPLIPVSGKPMVIQAVEDLPFAKKYIFVLRSDMGDYELITRKLEETYKNSDVIKIDKITNGQACTVLIGLEEAMRQHFIEEPITVGACDNGVIYDQESFEDLIKDQSIDVLVWCARGHTNAIRHPEMYGWIDADNVEIKSISVKKPLLSPSLDPIVLGTFTFKNTSTLKQIIEQTIDKDIKVNGEFYLDSCINEAIEMGLKCCLFEVESYISWGTPNDLKTFEYWQSCFSKWSSHPYKLEKDPKVDVLSLDSLNRKYAAILPYKNYK